MKFYTSAITLASCLASASAAATAKCIDVDVAVIGGGSSGIHAAVNLKDAGAKVAVIEKKDQIGGHAETYVNPKNKVVANIGVAVFEDSKSVNKYFTRLEVPYEKRNLFATAGTSQQYDFKLGFPIPAQSKAQAAATQQAQAAAMKAYAETVLTKYPWVDQGYLVPNPIPEELLLPFGEFAQKHNFAALLPIISQLNWYPGNITTIPALYGIKKFGAGLMQSVQNGFLVAKSGNTRSVYEAAAKVLGKDIYLDSHIVSVRRHKEGVKVVFKQHGKTLTVKAKKLVVAIPQTIENTKHFDLSEAERKVFSKFTSYGYVAGVANIPGFKTSLQNVGATTPAHTPLIPGSNGYNFFGSPEQALLGVAFDTSDYTIADSEAVIRRELTTLARAGALPADAAKKVTFSLISNHAPYYLHVTDKEIGHGFYHDLLKLEGQRNTYYTGAAFTGHNSGLIWNWNDGTVLPALKKDLGL
ncbi:hypothetical protein F53441_1668 [Fusarium austroafricanum]|uniref:monoamine oxidase n=1 Tax=Fusarium austroafricanum TaxID=2364996 RepID=A0A8H4P3S6_9HYPO|nr:hypothetical protein F53441_1668 [Fusarium austroafricanum]